MRKIFFIVTAMCFVISVRAQQDESIKTQTGNLNKPERQEWLRDLGFGMFIHWSMDSQLGTVISHSMVGASPDYLDRYLNELPKTFDPQEFDAHKIATQAKLAGMKYIVFTAKHHSGFCMWDTESTDFNIMNTPYGKDLLKEYVEGVRKAGLAVGLYFSPEDFNFLHEQGITIRRRGVELDNSTEKKYHELIRQQTRELFSNYGNIDVLFIDGDPKEPCKEEAWRLQPDLVITRGAVNTPEQRLPGIADDNLWESCVTMGTQWNYKPTNDDLKPAGRIIEMLIETRAKGGNLLLNIGPDPYGSIPDPESRNLTEMAAWNFVNQEAVLNVRPWIITHEENIWFTASKDRNTVYAIITGLPGWRKGDRKEFVLGSVKATENTRISVLGQNDKVVEYRPTNDPQSKYRQDVDGLHISVVRAQRIYNNSKWPNPVTVKLENVEAALDPPAIKTLRAQSESGKIILKGELLQLGDASKLKVGFEYRPYAGFVENLYSTHWDRTELFDISEKGDFQTEMTDLEENTEYEFRAVVIHPQMSIYGDIRRILFK